MVRRARPSRTGQSSAASLAVVPCLEHRGANVLLPAKADIDAQSHGTALEQCAVPSVGCTQMIGLPPVTAIVAPEM